MTYMDLFSNFKSEDFNINLSVFFANPYKPTMHTSGSALMDYYFK